MAVSLAAESNRGERLSWGEKIGLENPSRIGWPFSGRVAKMEAADTSVELDLMIRALLALAAKPSEIVGAIDWAVR